MQADGAAISIRRRLVSPLGARSWNTSTFACAVTIPSSSTWRNFHFPKIDDGVLGHARHPFA